MTEVEDDVADDLEALLRGQVDPGGADPDRPLGDVDRLVRPSASACGSAGTVAIPSGGKPGSRWNGIRRRRAGPAEPYGR